MATNTGASRTDPNQYPDVELQGLTAEIFDNNGIHRGSLPITGKRRRSKSLGAFVRVAQDVLLLMAMGHDTKQADGTTKKEFLTGREFRVMSFCLAKMDYENKVRHGAGKTAGAPDMSRADMAEALGLAPSNLSPIVKKLITVGYLYEIQIPASRSSALIVSPHRASRAKDFLNSQLQQAIKLNEPDQELTKTRRSKAVDHSQQEQERRLKVLK